MTKELIKEIERMIANDVNFELQIKKSNGRIIKISSKLQERRGR